MVRAPFVAVKCERNHTSERISSTHEVLGRTSQYKKSCRLARSVILWLSEPVRSLWWDS